MSDLHEKEAIRLCRSTTTIETIVDLTRHASPQVRQAALKEMCPCRVKKDHDDFWKRVLEMIDDEATNVRFQVLHTLCDGSPAHLEFDVAEALDKFNRDRDPKIRRTAHRVLTTYWKTGKWNVL
ncbi:uncharacterized protein LOC110449844 [Mizuhopecten yessoensis]|uniref:HEAT repeat domain-containing protein n=1 Tax=Mizuhopecten yessoensis TaxID=6573 RepID=A0A210QQA0_MIZYE|nr:uncharacterized protein LOC110449844 [Mizuhopecten yessoensis]OWF50926.1 hypothetical protein KP79_PYT07450 [Mizuhopecten yessoensis]